MTQATLARALQLKGMNVDSAGVAKIEGKYRQVSDVELVLIAQALGRLAWRSAGGRRGGVGPKSNQAVGM